MGADSSTSRRTGLQKRVRSAVMVVAALMIAAVLIWQGIPAWARLWFSVFPSVQTFMGQAGALLLVAGACFIARYRMWKLVSRQAPEAGVAISSRKEDGGGTTPIRRSRSVFPAQGGAPSRH
jgi:TRAP-type C4-dicarboxylate transport system permease small subunit